MPTFAPLHRRLFALIYDVMLLAAVLFCVAGAYFTLLLVIQAGGEQASSLGAAQTGDVLKELEVIQPGWPFYPLMSAIYLGFFLYFWRLSGQTLGMRAWKIRLQDESGATPGWWQLVLRLPAALLSLACAGLGYWVLLWPGVNHCWHDRLSRTRVVMVS
ncbi:MAG: RDD family protein [Gammaproteobacteria bacterium]|nr:RDD family protein [Gammaproteobacteria bacterium]NND40057.1 RDD family protein [Pseudomonadales bacterium]MBT8150054.1 RDD family protein [Gammaproteobacteria bacterium]NNL11320.1 RDD family protein [Pseudomonadales bacterium]NNM10933.1 RDD family protein [Pseudomonadales bacterium]